MTVRAAYQLGLQSPATYQDYGVQERELRKRLWYGVINQDRYLTISLGRPCLISSHHILVEMPDEHQAGISSTPSHIRSHVDGLIYFNHLMYAR